MRSPKADADEIRRAESGDGEQYQAWLLVARDGLSFQNAGNILFPNDSTEAGRKAKARRRWETVEEEFGRYHATTRHHATARKHDPPRDAILGGPSWPDSLWAAWLSPT
jgi:hypothetical protein